MNDLPEKDNKEYQAGEKGRDAMQTECVYLHTKKTKWTLF